MKPKRPSRRLISVQINLDELNALDPMLRARIIGRAQRKYAKEAAQDRFCDALDVEEDP